MLTPNLVLKGLRIAAVVCAVALTGLLLGPFQGLERHFGLSDFAAHAMAAFAVSLGLFAVAPRWRRLDIALVVIALGALVEIAQGLTGRSMSLSDLGADVLGVGIAILPGFIEQFRRMVQTAPYESFASIRSRDRRRPRPKGAKVYVRRTVRAEGSAVR